MRLHLTPAWLGPVLAAGAVAAAWLLPVTDACAFTVENRDAGGTYTMPKYDLEEQAKQFRNGGTGSATAGNTFETPLGDGTVQFSARPQSSFGPMGPSFWSSGTRATRRDFERMTAPPNSRFLYDQ